MICTDLDITVDGGSCEEVEASIEPCRVMHLERVVKSPLGGRRRSLARRATSAHEGTDGAVDSGPSATPDRG